MQHLIACHFTCPLCIVLASNQVLQRGHVKWWIYWHTYLKLEAIALNRLKGCLLQKTLRQVERAQPFPTSETNVHACIIKLFTLWKMSVDDCKNATELIWELKNYLARGEFANTVLYLRTVNCVSGNGLHSTVLHISIFLQFNWKRQ